MGTVYGRRNKLWIGYRDVDGARKYAPTKFTVGQEPKARKLLEAIERRIQAAASLGDTALGPLTVNRYTKRWIEDRLFRKVGSSSDDEARLRLHALPQLGELVLAEVRPSHIRKLVRNLRARIGASREHLAPRTVRHVYGVLHSMFEDAVAEELIDSNPCVLKRGELPSKIDKDPLWRAGAVFTRGEVEQLISDERIPEDRRVFYAIAFLAGMRTGEVSALRWSSYDVEIEPLGKLMVARSYSTKRRLEKAVKTQRPREVPVHPTLAKVLAAWKLAGWERMLGRSPGLDELLIPSRVGRNRTTNHMLHKFYEDLERIGLRRRRQYDSRRTFISLAQADGARKDILRWVTHGPDGDIVSLYTTLPWATLCEEVAKLKIGLRKGTLIALPKAANSGGGDGDLLHPLLQTHRVNEKALKSRGLESHFDHGGGGNRTRVRKPSARRCYVCSPRFSLELLAVADGI
jgi:integrase